MPEIKGNKEKEKQGAIIMDVRARQPVAGGNKKHTQKYSVPSNGGTTVQRGKY